jgi:hypothetical protein
MISKVKSLSALVGMFRVPCKTLDWKASMFMLTGLKAKPFFIAMQTPHSFACLGRKCELNVGSM